MVIKELLWSGCNFYPYLFASICVGTATVLRFALDPILRDQQGLLPYYGALAATAWRGGWGPAVFSIISSYLLADWFFLAPRYELSVFSSEPFHLVECGTFVGTGLMIAAFSETAKRAKNAAECSARQVENARQELEDRVQARTAELAEANKELEAFSYSVSHDLRAPLRSVICFTEMLQKESKLVASDEEMLSRILQSSKRMDELLTDLLSLSHASRDSMRLEETDLSALAREILAGLQGAEPHRQMELLIEPGLTAHADPRLLRIALENLLSNAWKFTRRCSQARIEFSAKIDEGKVVYRVRDNGAGFDMAHAARLFGVFQRLHSDRDFPGTGIGLVIVQRIVNRHGGQVWAEGAINEGASFYFTLSADAFSA